MPRDQISRLARRRAYYTGETFERARQALAELTPGSCPLPAAAAADQLHLEADAFSHLLHSRSAYCEFPFGIRSTRPSCDSLTLEVESEHRAEELLRHLLPAHEPDGEVQGIAGLRVRQLGANGIELHQPGRATSLWLTGPSRSVWETIEARQLAWICELGWAPSWRQAGGWSEAEVRAAGEDAWLRRFREGAWLTSGLLRRLPLFHTIAVPHSVSAYLACGPGTAHWKMELDHLPHAGYRAEALASALADDVFGLPLAVRGHGVASDDPEETRTRIRLADKGRTGILEMLFCRWSSGLRERDPQMFQAIVQRTAAVEGRPVPRSERALR